MPIPHPLYAAIRLIITCLVLAIGLRCWLLMGLIAPVTVAGSSMAPTLCGAFVTPQCPDCGHTFRVGAEFAANAGSVACPQCLQTSVALSELPRRHGDRLWIDRTSLGWRAAERWEVIVARNPQDAAELCVKRVVGLPGETIAVRDGNVLVDGAILVKSIEQQRRLRQVVHRENLSSCRWQAEATTAWQWSGQAWQHQGRQDPNQGGKSPRVTSHGTKTQQPIAPPGSTIDWLAYQHPHAQPLTDDVTYNAGLTRQLHLVDEFMLSAELSIQGAGTLALRLGDGTATAEVQLQLPEGAMVLLVNGRPAETADMSLASRQRLALGKALLEFSNFDRQLLLTIAGQLELCRPWPYPPAAGTDRPVSIGAQGLAVRLDNLTLYRDLYYGTQAVGVRPPLTAAWRLAADEYFLLGDNAPVSLDSRGWGPVPRRLVVGKLLGSR